MKIDSLMTTELATCGPDDSLKTAAQLMWTSDCGLLPVVVDGKLEGVLTDRDICMAAYFEDVPLSKLRVRDVMVREVETCRPDAEIEEAHAVMARAQVRRVPVVGESNELIGLISMNDIALAASSAETGGDGTAAVASTLAAISAHRSTLR
jgi:CBS domain-containing protein